MAVTFYATIDHRQLWPHMPQMHVLLPASSWRSVNFRAPQIPKGVAAAADSGAYRAMIAGGYQFSVDQYVTWLDSFRPNWAATRDWVCAFADPETVLELQQQTTEHARMMWREYCDVAWSWTPVIQGWTVQEYRRHAQELRPLLADMRRTGHAWRVGVGTLKVRETALEISTILRVIHDVIPEGRLHLFGVGLGMFQHSDAYFPGVVSTDTSVWDGRCGHKARHQTNFEQTTMGLSRMEHSYQIALPRYLKKFEEALNRPKQPSLF